MEGDGGGGKNLASGRGLRTRDRDLVESFIQLGSQGRIVHIEREWKAKILGGENVRGGLGLNEIERLALGVKILFENPMLNLRALIGELNLEEFVLYRCGGDDGGGDFRRGA